MPLHAIWRTYPPMTKDEEDTMHFLAIAGTHWMPGVRWVRSLGLPDKGGHKRSLCFYEGPTPDSVVMHARSCGLPVDSTEAVRENLGAGMSGFGSSGEGPLFLVTRRDLSAIESTTSRTRHLRVFICVESGRSLHVLSGVDAETVALDCDLQAGDLLEAVSEALPRDAASLFDALGLPHYWEEPSPAPV